MAWLLARIRHNLSHFDRVGSEREEIPLLCLIAIQPAALNEMVVFNQSFVEVPRHTFE
jgi:hypothetical protein